MNNRAIILETALQYFAAFGYETTAIQDICETSGITKPTLYYYFKSKQGLIQAILSENFQPFLTRLKDACEYHGDLTLNLENVMRVYFTFADENPTFYRLQFSMQYAPSKSESRQEVLSWTKRQQDLVQELFRNAERDHGNMQGRSEAYAVTLLGMINTYVLRALEHKQELTDELLYQARQQFMHGIFS
ncbi:MAG: TetR/AcrR family transcriptional regulator [Anaerolineaceae bacterium]